MEEKLNSVPINDNEEEKESKIQQPFWTKPKKMLVVLICAIIVLIVYIISILPYIGSPEVKDTDQPTPQPEPQPHEDKGDFLGKIYCLFSLVEDGGVNILNKVFRPGNITVYVDNVIISNEKLNNYKLNGKGNHNVTFALYEDIDMSNMFNGVENLERVEMSSDKNCKITKMESAFYYCRDLQIFSIKGFNTESVESLKNLFSHSSLASIKFENFDTKNVKDTSYMFYSTPIEELDLSFMDTRKVEDMKYMFGYCTSLTSLKISNFNTENVKDMNHMFNHLERFKNTKSRRYELLICRLLQS